MKRLALLAAAGLVALSACDRAKPRHPDAAPVLPYAKNAPAPTPQERAGLARWDPSKGAFTLNGQPFNATKLWSFDDSTEGFTALGAETSLDPAGGLRLINRHDTPLLLSPTDLTLPGRNAPFVLIRLTRVAPGDPWDGGLYYSTAQHGWAEAYRGRVDDKRPPEVNETVTYVFDLSKAGDGDWTNSIINQLRFDTDVHPGGAFIVRQVAIGAPAAPATPAGAAK